MRMKQYASWMMTVHGGARPMARIIQEKIKIPLSEFILKSKHPTGTIKVDFCKDKNKFILQYDTKEEKKLTFSS